MHELKRCSVLVAADVEERGPLSERLLFWLLKHPYQRLSDVAFVFGVHPSTMSRQLNRLVKKQLVETVQCACIAPVRSEMLYYLTSAGICEVARLVGTDPEPLAELWQVNETALLRLLPRLHAHIPLQEVIYAFVEEAPRRFSGSDRSPVAIRWHWQHAYRHTFLSGATQRSCLLDGVVVLRRRLQTASQAAAESWSCVFWLIDPGLVGADDVPVMRMRIRQLLQWRESPERWSTYHAFPPVLIVAPTDHQRDLWVRCAQEEAATLHVAPLQGACATRADRSPWNFSWQRLDGTGPIGLRGVIDALPFETVPSGLLAPRMFPARKRHAATATIVQGAFALRAGQDVHDDTPVRDYRLLSLQLCYRHLDLLRQIYAMPLIEAGELAALLRFEPTTVRRYLADVQALGCITTITTIRGKRLALSEDGLRLLAAALGVSLSHVAQRLPASGWQQRGLAQALRLTEHTASVYAFLAQLQRQAWGLGQRMLWWETQRCILRYRWQGAWHNLMPDALFAYQQEDRVVEAWLEWDTGTMHTPALLEKFEAYEHYVRSLQYRQDHQVPPSLLLVVPQQSRELLMQRIVASALGERAAVWTTTASRLSRHGPLSAIWWRVRVGDDLDVPSSVQRGTWVQGEDVCLKHKSAVF